MESVGTSFTTDCREAVRRLSSALKKEVVGSIAAANYGSATRINSVCTKQLEKVDVAAASERDAGCLNITEHGNGCASVLVRVACLCITLNRDRIAARDARASR